MLNKLRYFWAKTPPLARQVAVLCLGIALLAAGAAMLVLPGPGWATIFLGLAVLASEFYWADQLKSWLLKRFKSALNWAKNRAGKI
ncbi:MAG: hypothetical protein EOT04_02625 [Candidatus Chaera renei]|uniref:TIGR02611 family protein n=1 Tax=Candidatus Chaera renei TaxID=2506947 RepID=A0A4Q0AIP4_9BACT|nr:MAG: hypothetical protein EOT04_02625 [Candidatus Chaera renei]